MATSDLQLNVKAEFFVGGEMLTADKLNKLVRAVNENFPAIAVVKCAACGQWGARFCECKHCGSPID